MTRGVCEVTLSCILLLLSCCSLVEEGQGRLQANILPCQALTAESGRMSDDYSPAFSHLYPKSHLPPSKTLIILHFVVPVHCSVISCHHCTLQLLPLRCHSEGERATIVLSFFSSLLFTQFETSIKHLLSFF